MDRKDARVERTARALTWDAAPATILAALDAGATGAGCRIVGITGPVGSGKSTLAQRLGGVVISTDSYLPDYATVKYEERDRPELADLEAMTLHLAALRAGRAARVPVWSFQSHRREGTREVGPAPLVVVEGIHALHEKARAHLDVGVYVDAPALVRWARWERLEASGVRGWGVTAAREYFERVAEPTFLAHGARYREHADFLVSNPGGP